MAYASDSNSSRIEKELLCLKEDELLDRYLDNLRYCPKGHSLRKILGDSHVKFCDVCNDVIGADDSMSVYEIDAIVNTWTYTCSRCGNHDINSHTVTYQGLKCYCGYLTSFGQSEIKDRIRCPCGNENLNTIDCVRSKNKDEFLGFRCHCGKEWRYESVDDFEKDVEERTPKSEASGKDMKNSKVAGKIEVSTAADIKRANHIMFWRPSLLDGLGYYHHAVVNEVYPDENAIDVIHYDGPIKGGRLIKGELTASRLELDNNTDQMFVAEYDGPVYDDDMCLFRATTRLGEKSYNLLTNNCEHFARWCKTGVEYSNQVDAVIDKVKDVVRELSNLVQKGAEKIVYRGAGQIITSLIKHLTTSGGAKGAVTKAFTSNAVKYLGPAAVVGVEVYHAVKDISHEYYKYKKQEVTQREFIGVSVQRSTKAALGCVGAIGGAWLGQIIIPIPVVGAFIGTAFGAMLGHFVGSKLGKWFQKKIGK